MYDNLAQKLDKLHTYKTLPLIIIGIGVILRMVRYVYNPSLWFDESRNAQSILSMSLSDYIPPASDLTTSINVGFIVLEKLAAMAFGNSEYVLRILSIVPGILSLPLFYWVAKRYIRPNAVIIGLGLFAVLDPFIYFSSELKPYMCDAAFALLIYASVARMQHREYSTSSIIISGVCGAVAVWISHPAVFVLAGIGITLAVSSLMRKNWQEFGKLLIVFSMWAVGFVSVFFLYTLPLMGNFNVGSNDIFWARQQAFMPFPPTSAADIQWYVDVLFRTFTYPLGFTLSGIAVMAFIAGIVSAWSSDREKLFLLLSPVIITLLATTLHKYTFVQGQILFVAPALLLLAAEGVEYVRKSTYRSAPAIGTILILLLFLYPSAWAVYHVKKPVSREEIKPVLSYVKQNWQERDKLYVYYMSQFAFDYYTNYHPGDFGFDETEYVIGRGPRDWYSNYIVKEFKGYWNPDKPFSQPYTSIFAEYIKDMNQMKGHGRVWVLFSSIVPKAGIHEEKFYLYHLNTIGKRLDSFGRAGISAVYLFDLSQKDTQQIPSSKLQITNKHQ